MTEENKEEMKTEIIEAIDGSVRLMVCKGECSFNLSLEDLGKLTGIYCEMLDIASKRSGDEDYFPF